MAPVVHSICASKHEELVEPIVERIAQLEDTVPDVLALRGEIGHLRREFGEAKSVLKTLADALGRLEKGLQQNTTRLDGRDKQILDMLGKALHGERKAHESLTDIAAVTRKRSSGLRYKLVIAALPVLAAVGGRVSANVGCSPAPIQAPAK